MVLVNYCSCGSYLHAGMDVLISVGGPGVIISKISICARRIASIGVSALEGAPTIGADAPERSPVEEEAALLGSAGTSTLVLVKPVGDVSGGAAAAAGSCHPVGRRQGPRLMDAPLGKRPFRVHIDPT